MNPTRSITYRAQICLAALLAIFFLCFSNACTVKREPVQPGVIPKFAGPSPKAEDYGKFLFDKLSNDYETESDIQKNDKLNAVFDKLTKAAEVDHLTWNIHLLSNAHLPKLQEDQVPDAISTFHQSCDNSRSENETIFLHRKSRTNSNCVGRKKLCECFKRKSHCRRPD